MAKERKEAAAVVRVAQLEILKEEADAEEETMEDVVSTCRFFLLPVTKYEWPYGTESLSLLQ